MPKISNNDLAADISGLPNADTDANIASSDQIMPKTRPRPIQAINDTGRIKFGAACRIPLPK